MPKNALRLLSLDGGGVRGLSSLMILKELMEAINPESPPKPCEYFDLIGGTSTGGLIAVMLGRLKMTIEETIDAYCALSERVFEKTRNPISWRGHVQGKFNHEELERAIEDTIKRATQNTGEGQMLPTEVLLKDTAEDACKVFVCATDKVTRHTVCMTSYSYTGCNRYHLDTIKLWEACRATSAASGFYDPIKIGKHGEEFIDGAMGANNPVQEVWNQAQEIWGDPDKLYGDYFHDKVQQVVSIGTGLPDQKDSSNSVKSLIDMMVVIATETEATARKFQADKSHLDMNDQYFRFNVTSGLQRIGLEEWKKRGTIVAFTNAYLRHPDMKKKMLAFVGSSSGKRYNDHFRVDFNLSGVPVVKTFVGRDNEMHKLKEVLLPPNAKKKRKIFVLHGMGGIGKTQLAVNFARSFSEEFSAVFWLDGSTKESLRQSIARCAERLPSNSPFKGSTVGKTVKSKGRIDQDFLVELMLNWLAQKKNHGWLVVFDNVDREYNATSKDPQAYAIAQYLSADHGSYLITTRLTFLERFGESVELGRVDDRTAREILHVQYGKSGKSRLPKAYQKAIHELVEKLGGLPLAIAQAGAYMKLAGTTPRKYLQYYETEWCKLFGPSSGDIAPLMDSGSKSIWTTWTISSQEVLRSNERAANLLALWSFLDNKDLWYGIFEGMGLGDAVGHHEWWTIHIGDIWHKEVSFEQAMMELRKYSLIEESQLEPTDESDDWKHYSIHAVVHKWAYHYCCQNQGYDLAAMVTMVVTWCRKSIDSRGDLKLLRRLLPHALACSRMILEHIAGRPTIEILKYVEPDERNTRSESGLLDALLELSEFFLKEQLFDMAIQTCDGILEHVNPSEDRWNGAMLIKATVLVFRQQDNASEEALLDALRSDTARTPQTMSTYFGATKVLGVIYHRQKRFDKLEKMLEQALEEIEGFFGSESEQALEITHHIIECHCSSGKHNEVQRLAEGLLQTMENIHGKRDPYTLWVAFTLGTVYDKQGKTDQAETLFSRAIQGLEDTIGPDHINTIHIMIQVGVSYMVRGNIIQSKSIITKALENYKDSPHSQGEGSLMGILDGLISGMDGLQRRADISTEVQSMLELSYSCMMQGKHEEARSLINEARRKHNDSPDSHSDSGKDEIFENLLSLVDSGERLMNQFFARGVNNPLIMDLGFQEWGLSSLPEAENSGSSGRTTFSRSEEGVELISANKDAVNSSHDPKIMLQRRQKKAESGRSGSAQGNKTNKGKGRAE